MWKAVTVIVTVPVGMLSHTTCSTLLTRSKFFDVPMLPWRAWPFDAVTIRSRSFCSLAPGGSDQTSVTFKVGPVPVVCAPLDFFFAGTVIVTVLLCPCFNGPPSPQPPFGLGPGTMIEPARLTRPQPDDMLGDVPASVGLYCPGTVTAPLIRIALMTAALGVGMPFFTSVSRTTATQPATSGVAMLVPPSKKKAGSVDTP